MPFMHCCSLYRPRNAGKGAGNRGVCAFVAVDRATSPQLTWWYVTTGHRSTTAIRRRFQFHIASYQLLFSIRRACFSAPPVSTNDRCLAGEPSGRPLEAAVSILITLIAFYLGAPGATTPSGIRLVRVKASNVANLEWFPLRAPSQSLLATVGDGHCCHRRRFLIAVNVVHFRGYIKALCFITTIRASPMPGSGTTLGLRRSSGMYRKLSKTVS